MKAEYASPCTICGEVIFEGDDAILINKSGTWAHRQCVKSEGFVDEEEQWPSIQD